MLTTNLEFVQDFSVGTAVKTVSVEAKARKEMGGQRNGRWGRGLTKLMMYERVIWKPTTL